MSEGPDAGEGPCVRSGHEWTPFVEDPDWYDGTTYECVRCRRIAFACVNGSTGPVYEDPIHDRYFTAIGHEWLLGPPPDAPCGSQSAECVRCRLGHTRWSDVPHEWVYDNPKPALEDPEWAMAFGLVDWVGSRRCSRCGVTAYRNPRW